MRREIPQMPTKNDRSALHTTLGEAPRSFTRQARYSTELTYTSEYEHRQAALSQDYKHFVAYQFSEAVGQMQPDSQ